MAGALHSSREAETAYDDALNLNERTSDTFELPIDKHRTEIEDSIRENSVTILASPTGTGKTTKVPQFALRMKDEHDQFLFDVINVTQPRVIAARTVCERVKDENAKSGEQYAIGYFTSREQTDALQSDQDLAFLTDGKAAAQLLHRGPGAEHRKQLLVIDEVHEWNSNIELLIALVTERTDPDNVHYDPNLTVVIMSATMETERLQKHFNHATPPIITIEAQTYPIESSVTNRSVANMALRSALETKETVLAFLPGKREIRNTAYSIGEKQKNLPHAIPVVPLFGQQSEAEQRKALGNDEQVIIAATNVAETSVTIPDVGVVVDSGKVRKKRTIYSLVSTGSEMLGIEDASQKELWQRRGRTGRTGSGKYVLASLDEKPPTPIEERPEYTTPAIECQRLDDLLLNLKAAGRDINELPFFHKPPAHAVKAARARLHTLGALDERGVVTPRGLRMSRLPLDAEYACMITFAYEKGYSDDVKQHLVDIAAIMQQGGILRRGPNEQNWRDLLAIDAAGDVREKDSDFFAQLEVYNKLMNDVQRDKWEEHHVIVRAVDLVERDRTVLAERLNLTLQESTAITPENRRAVLTCINAGQLNQLWSRKGSEWSLVQEKSASYALAESSVVGALGQYATGALFSLGVGPDKTIHGIENVNLITTEALEKVAEHLITDVMDRGSMAYDPETGQLTASVYRKLGNLTLRMYSRAVDVDPNSLESQMISDGHRAEMWNQWPEHNNAPKVHKDLKQIEQAIQSPESAQYGTDPITGAALQAWRGGKGKWCQTKEDAVKSLEASRNRLINLPKEMELRELKVAVKARVTELTALKNSGLVSASEVKSVMSTKRKLTKQEWLMQADELIKLARIS